MLLELSNRAKLINYIYKILNYDLDNEITVCFFKNLEVVKEYIYDISWTLEIVKKKFDNNL